MSGPDLHVITLKFLALKNLVFSLFRGQNNFSPNIPPKKFLPKNSSQKTPLKKFLPRNRPEKFPEKFKEFSKNSQDYENIHRA